jgi:hypothetical protein
LCDSDFFFPNEDWNPVTEEETVIASPFVAYMGAKTLAEKAVWKFAEEHKHVDVTVCKVISAVPLTLNVYVVNPPYFFGPFIPGFRIPKPDYSALHIYHFLTKKGRAFSQIP